MKATSILLTVLATSVMSATATAAAQAPGDQLKTTILQHFTIQDGGDGQPAFLNELVVPEGTSFRDFADAMNGKGFDDATTSISGVTIIWSRTQARSTGNKQIVITASKATIGKNLAFITASAGENHDLVTVYAVGGHGTGNDANAFGSPNKRTWSFADGGEAGPATSGGFAFAEGGALGGDARSQGGSSVSNADKIRAGGAKARAHDRFKASSTAGKAPATGAVQKPSSPIIGSGDADAIAEFGDAVAEAGNAPGPDMVNHRRGGSANARSGQGTATAKGGKGANHGNPFVEKIPPAKAGQGGAATARSQEGDAVATGGGGGDALLDASPGGDGGDGGAATADSHCKAGTAKGGPGGIGEVGGHKGGNGGSALAIAVGPSASGGDPGVGKAGAVDGEAGKMNEVKLPPCP